VPARRLHYPLLTAAVAAGVFRQGLHAAFAGVAAAETCRVKRDSAINAVVADLTPLLSLPRDTVVKQ
jgi:hypothetical protein